MNKERTRKARRGLMTAAVIGLAAAAVIPAYAGSPEFARSEEEWARLRDNIMEYEEIEDLIHEYNVTVRNNEHSYNDLKEDPDADDIAETYLDAAEDIRDTITGDSELADAMAEAQAKQLEQLADDNTMDLKVYRLTYDQVEKSLSMVAQNQLAAYHQACSNLETLKKSRVLLEEVQVLTEAQHSVGLASRLDVITAQKDVKTMDASISELETSIRSLKQNLCVMMGWKYDAEPEIMGIPAVDEGRIEAMNPTADYPTALENNYTLNINKRKLENAEGMYTQQTLENTIADNKQKIGTALETDYRAVLQKQIALEEAKSKLETEQIRMNVISEQYGVGLASRLAYMQQETALFTQEQAVKQAEIDLFMAMETYDWDVRGMASTE